jgi:hypothetical protein
VRAILNQGIWTLPCKDVELEVVASITPNAATLNAKFAAQAGNVGGFHSEDGAAKSSDTDTKNRKVISKLGAFSARDVGG